MSSQRIKWEDLPQGVQDAVLGGRKIEAIKLLREARGIGLKEAKDEIDAHFEERGVTSQGRGCLLIALVPLAALAALLAERVG